MARKSIPDRTEIAAFAESADHELDADDGALGGEIQTLTIAVKILDMLASGRKELKAAVIARELSMTPPRTWRHLRTMLRLGLVDQSPVTGAFRLSWRLVQLGQSAASQYSVTDVAHQFLLELRDQLSLTVYLTMPFKDGAVVAQCLSGGVHLSLVLHAGTYFPFHAAASSRVLLAFSSVERQAQLLSLPLSPDAEPDPITSMRELKERLDLIRDRFYDVAINNLPFKVEGISAPVFDHNNDIVATVGLLAGIERVDAKGPAGYADSLMRCAAKISGALGSTRWQTRLQ